MATVTTLDALIERYRLDLTPADVLSQWEAALAAVPGTSAAPLTEAETTFLADHAGSGAAGVIAGWDAKQERHERVALAMRNVETLMGESVTPAVAARRIGIHRSQVTRRIAKRTLYSFTMANGHHRLPVWQFTGSRILPGLDAVVPAIPDDLAPLSVQAFMRADHDELGGRSPVAHLSQGGDPSAVARLVTDLDQW